MQFGARVVAFSREVAKQKANTSGEDGANMEESPCTKGDAAATRSCSNKKIAK